MTASGRTKRLLIGADSFVDAKPALRISEALLGTGIGDIGGIFFENPQNVEILPVHAQCVITSAGTVCLAPTPAQRQVLFDSDAKAFRKDLARIAEASTIAWKFNRDRGDPVQQLFSAARDWDMLVIGHRRISSQTGRVISILPEGPEAEKTRELSEQLSRALRTETLVIREKQTEASLLTSISRTCAVAVVIDVVAGPVQDAEQIRKLLDVARCPVLILGVPASSKQDQVVPEQNRPRKGKHE